MNEFRPAPGTRAITWHMMKFEGAGGLPAYVDLRQVAAIEPAQEKDVLLPGAMLHLVAGGKLYVRASADAVFDQVFRATQMQEPAPAAPAVAPIPPNSGHTETIS